MNNSILLTILLSALVALGACRKNNSTTTTTSVVPKNDTLVMLEKIAKVHNLVGTQHYIEGDPMGGHQDTTYNIAFSIEVTALSTDTIVVRTDPTKLTICPQAGVLLLDTLAGIIVFSFRNRLPDDNKETTITYYYVKDSMACHFSRYIRRYSYASQRDTYAHTP